MQWYWANFKCRGVLLVWIKVGQGPTALTSLSLSLGDDPIYTDILLSQRAVKPYDPPTSIILLADID